MSQKWSGPRFIAHLLYIIAFCFGHSAAADGIDDAIRAQQAEHRIPGLAIAILRDSQPVRMGGYGKANLELNVPVEPHTVFEIGSLTKQFTAAAILMLQQEKKLMVSDKLQNFFITVPESWNGITLHHLLTHTSGIRNYTGLEGFESRLKLTREEFISKLAVHPLVTPPGEKFAYCNSGYNLLGYVVELSSQQSYYTFLSNRIFRPLAMESTYARDQETIIPHRAAGYELKAGQLVNRDSDLTDVFAAGALVSTVKDLAKWAQAVQSKRLLNDESWRQKWTPVQLNSGTNYPYGYGWRLSDYKGYPNIGHSGSTSGFSASFQVFPKQKTTIIVLCNLGVQGVANKVAYTLADTVLK